MLEVRHAHQEDSEGDNVSSRGPTPVNGSSQRLLGDSDDIDNEKRHDDNDDGDDDLDQGSRFCAIDRWWKVFMLLLLSTLLLPLVIKSSMPYKLSKHSHKPAKSHTWIRPADDYVLSHDWDFNAEPQLREYDWTVSDAEINPDGVYRQMLVINGQFPGPLVRANEGDTIKVTVHNSAVNATSIHWHGMYQNGTNHMDGTVGVTQCPIAPGRSFTYQFKVESQSGTYWYHGHHGAQAVDGLYGPLVIHAKDEKQIQKLDYASDRIVMLSDYYHDLSGALLYQYLAPDAENAEPVPDGALINGRGTRDCSTVPHRKCDNSTGGIDTSFFALTPNEHHRLRIINVGAFAEFQFQIDEHEMAITEVDGTDVWPKSYHRLNINPAQRYSVVIHTNVTTSTSFWMRARMITTCFAERNPNLIADINAVVSYSSASPSAASTQIPISKDWQEALWLECRDLNVTELVPVQAVPAPSTADAFFYLRSNFEIGAYRLSRGFFNSSSWRADVHSPILSRTVTGLRSGNTSFTTPSAPAANAAFSPALVIQSQGLATIDLLVHNFDDGNHPMHLHGYKYFVLAAGHGSPPRLDPLRGPDRANIQPLYDGLDLASPLRRDTASVEAYGWLLLRFVADNPGVWAFHCHVAWHTEAGLLMQFLTRTEGLAGLDVGDEHRGLCAAEGLERGGAPRDEDYYAVAR